MANGIVRDTTCDDLCLGVVAATAKANHERLAGGRAANHSPDAKLTSMYLSDGRITKPTSPRPPCTCTISAFTPAYTVPCFLGPFCPAVFVFLRSYYATQNCR